MDNWIAIPMKKVNDIEFGMERSEVRKKFAVPAREFKKSKYSKRTTDDFGNCHVYYDGNDKCEAVEIFDEVAVYVDDKKIFPVTVEEVKKIIPDLVEEEDSYISEKLSIGIYAPDDKMESILIGCEGYYGE